MSSSHHHKDEQHKHKHKQKQKKSSSSSSSSKCCCEKKKKHKKKQQLIKQCCPVLPISQIYVNQFIPDPGVGPQPPIPPPPIPPLSCPTFQDCLTTLLTAINTALATTIPTLQAAIASLGPDIPQPIIDAGNALQQLATDLQSLLTFLLLPGTTNSCCTSLLGAILGCITTSTLLAAALSPGLNTVISEVFGPPGSTFPTLVTPFIAALASVVNAITSCELGTVPPPQASGAICTDVCSFVANIEADMINLVNSLTLALLQAAGGNVAGLIARIDFFNVNTLPALQSATCATLTTELATVSNALNAIGIDVGEIVGDLQGTVPSITALIPLMDALQASLPCAIDALTPLLPSPPIVVVCPTYETCLTTLLTNINNVLTAPGLIPGLQDAINDLGPFPPPPQTLVDMGNSLEQFATDLQSLLTFLLIPANSCCSSLLGAVLGCMASSLLTVALSPGLASVIDETFAFGGVYETVGARLIQTLAALVDAITSCELGTVPPPPSPPSGAIYCPTVCSSLANIEANMIIFVNSLTLILLEVATADVSTLTTEIQTFTTTALAALQAATCSNLITTLDGVNGGLATIQDTVASLIDGGLPVPSLPALNTLFVALRDSLSCTSIALPPLLL